MSIEVTAETAEIANQCTMIAEAADNLVLKREPEQAMKVLETSMNLLDESRERLGKILDRILEHLEEEEESSPRMPKRLSQKINVGDYI